MEQIKTKVLVVGGGPGGYVAAIRCGQLGLDTVLVEKDRLGGTCLIRGCIPSKALIHAAEQYEAMARAAQEQRFGISLASPPRLDFAETIRWKEGIVAKLNEGVTGLLRRAKVRTITGRAEFSDGKTCRVTADDVAAQITAEHVILATGSVPVELAALPFGGAVISSTEALSLSELPERLVIVGAGYIGLELGIAFRKLGVDVTVVEQRDRILPLYDDKLVAPVRQWLQRHGVVLHTGARARRYDEKGCALVVDSAGGETLSLQADKVLVTIGRRPLLDGFGLERMAVDTAGGFIRVDERCATSMRNVWAIGDIVGEPMLAHKATAQGEMVAEIIAGRTRRFDPAVIPSVCFTEPEIVAVGLDPAAAAAAYSDDVQAAVFPFQANGRALTLDAEGDGGFVRVVARTSDHRIVGIQAVGRHVSDLSGEFAHALEMGALLEDIAGTIHVHPTLSEAFHEAALKGLGHAIHI